ncbi:MAG: hypothetical protein U9Q74_01465, partial [Gemmatimonadota bacterium]|nr:hypothetical protein [Gemmatimonadota bacterium]
QAGHSRLALNYVCGVPSNTKSVIVHHFQFEPNRRFPSSPIVSVGSTVLRNDEAPTSPLNFPLQDFTVLLRVVVPTSTAGVYRNLLNIGNNSSNGAEIYITPGATQAVAEIRGSTNNPCPGQAIAYMTPLDLVAQFRDWGTGPTCRLDIGSGFGAWSTASNARSALGNPQIGWNQGSNGLANALYQRLTVATGLVTRQQLQEYDLN